jgi:hypothetical protein
MKRQRAELSFRNVYEARPVKIVADAAVSIRGLGGGRLIPLVILDTTDRPDVEEYIRVHQAAEKPGDVKTQWGAIEGHEGSVTLLLIFIRPAEVTLILEFDIVKQGILIEQALIGKGLYIQAGREGDRFIKNPDRPKVLIEIGDTGFRPIWDKLFHKQVEKYFRTEGLGRHEARRAAQAAIEKLRQFGNGFRMRDIAE